MTPSDQAALHQLLKRVDDVLGLSLPTDLGRQAPAADAAALVEVLAGMVDELERSHRRLIETNVQLVSLREVANRLISALDTGETTRAVARYLHRAFGFESAFLALVERETLTLCGTWTRGRNGREQSLRIELPLPGDRGALARSLWLNQSLLLRDPPAHPLASLPEDHPLAEVFAGLGSFACVPLQRSQVALAGGETHELCGGRCGVGDPGVLVPPPELDPELWAHEREDRQRHCLACDLFPILGLIGAARAPEAAPLTPADLALLESIALSVAPVVENARLYQELRRSERFREHVLNSMQSAIIAVNLGGEVLSFNPAAAELTGWTAEEVTGRKAGERFGSELGSHLEATLAQGSEVLRRTVRLARKDGSPVEASLATSLLRDDRRHVYGVIATLVDLGPIRRAEEQARQLDRLATLGRFTSSVAHEIRNPLTGIAAGVQYLARSVASDDSQRSNLGFIQGEIRRLDRIVQDLFDITHPKRMQMVEQPLQRALERALQSLQPLLAGRQLRVETDPALAVPAVPHDADQLQQVFINLVKNAAEASAPGGTIRVRLRHEPRDGAGAEAGRAGRALRVAVEDDGRGIAPGDLDRLFEPFFTTKEGGTGLGLYVTHDILKRHGGELRVESAGGRGATFVIELPLEPFGGTS